MELPKSQEKEISIKEKRINDLKSLYYSRPEIQKAVFEFAKNREVVPRYFEGFGKRPDALQFYSEVFELVKKGATSFHCSEELWQDPLEISTEMSEKDYNELRIGWDFLLDIDSKYIDYSKIMVKEILKILKFHGVLNVGLKFSGSKGFHLILPWKSFPKEINGIKTSDKFPEWPRIILKYINDKIHDNLVKEITRLSVSNEYVKDEAASEEVIPDLVLVAPRHLFRMPYSLHEKTSLSSVVLNPGEIDNFELSDAHPLKLTPEKLVSFTPNSEEGEATELLVQALDWSKENEIVEEKKEYSPNSFKPIQIKNLSEKLFPPCVKEILNGMKDGRKRGLFVLLNFFRGLNLDKGEIEKKISEWNAKNEVPLKNGYINAQVDWSFKRKPLMPPNCQEFYKGIGVCKPDNFCGKLKNPLNYVMRKSWAEENKEGLNKPAQKKGVGKPKVKRGKDKNKEEKLQAPKHN